MSSRRVERVTSSGATLSVVQEDAADDVVLAVDPGGTTGWAVWSGGNVKFGQTEGQLPFLEQTWEALLRYRPVVVIESYIVTAGTVQKSRQYEPLEIIGAMRWGAHLYGLDFVMQSPRAAKTFSTNSKLQTVGWYEPGIPHGMDAARHLLLYMATVRKEGSLLEQLVDDLG